MISSTEIKAPGQRYTHGPVDLEPFIAQIEDYDLFVLARENYDCYIVLRQGDHTNYRANQRVLIGYIKQPEPDGPWEENLDRSETPRIICGDRHTIPNDEISRLMALGRDALNEYLGLVDETSGLGDALERLID